MARKKSSSLHEWINSIGVTAAILVSAASAYFSWQSNQFKKEAFAFDAWYSTKCETKYRPLKDNKVLGVCWSVIITNQSELKVALVDTDFSATDENGTYSTNIFQEMLTTEGVPVKVPIVFDGGEAKTFIVRSPIRVSEQAAAIIEELDKNGQLPKYVTELSNVLAKEKLDFIGNKVDPIVVPAGVVGFTLQSVGAKRVVVSAKFRTGRGNSFSTTFSYPPGT